MASKAFEAAVRRQFAPRLASLGFVRHGTRYLRPRPPWRVHGLHVQQDKYNGSGFCRFTVNVTRALVPALGSARIVEASKGRDSIFAMPPAIRIGHLTEIRGDYWYDYLPDDAARIEASLAEALDDIEKYALPWLRWGIARIGRPTDRTRALAADARFRSFVDRLAGRESQPADS